MRKTRDSSGGSNHETAGRLAEVVLNNWHASQA
jgi:hypothetical protein